MLRSAGSLTLFVAVLISPSEIIIATFQHSLPNDVLLDSSKCQQEQPQLMNGFTPDPPIRLLVVDVDGTLVGADRQISPRVHRALEESRRRGVQVALSTGRPWFGAKHYVDALQLDGFHIFDS